MATIVAIGLFTAIFLLMQKGFSLQSLTHNYRNQKKSDAVNNTMLNSQLSRTITIQTCININSIETYGAANTANLLLRLSIPKAKMVNKNYKIDHL